MGMIGLYKPLFNNNKVNEIIVRNIFEDMLKGNFPKFGSPETRCSKCMFYKIICLPNPDYCGCYAGWKMTEE